ncbi:MAG: hypothetical protein ROZ64_14830 [Burkholderiaceae bacterium]|nr:hypothetical protein [Burkholderiaceae bacterium]
MAASTQAQPPDGVVESFDAAALTALPRNAQARAAWPAWRRGVQAFHWYNIPDSALSAAVPATPVPGQPRNRINAWNGLAADRAHSRLYSAANGGHGDYSGNEVCEIDLSADKPKWRMLREPTPAEYIVRSLSGDIHDYYRDDRPASTHTYYALHFLASRNAVFKFSAGSLWGSGGQANWKTDAFSLKNNDWHPPGTWPEVVPGSHRGVTARAICADPYSDEVYVAAPGEIRRFDPRRGEYEILAKWPNNSSSVSARPCAIDVERKRIVFFGDAYRMPDGGLLYDIKTNELREIRFSGANVADVLALKYNAAWYDERSGRFLLKTRKGADLYSVDPLTFQVAALETFDGTNIPDAANGVHTRWQWLPALGGYAYYPEYRSGIWFLATE